MKLSLLLFPLAALVIVLSATGCRRPQPPPAPPPPAVTANQPATREVMEWDEYPGRLEAVEMVELRARVSGYLQAVSFKEGAEVKKGDLLFLIDPRPYEAQLTRAQADLSQAQTKLDLAGNELARAEKLLKSKAISEEEADTRNKAVREAEAGLEAARASVEVARLNLDYCRVTAPINGRIGQKLMTEGNLVNGNQAQASLLTTIVSLDPVYGYFDADERSVLKYQELARQGKRAEVSGGKVPCELALADDTGFSYKGFLDFVNNQVDPGTGTLRVRGVFENPGPDRVLQPGLFARVRVPGSGKYQALLIPPQAVGTDQGQKFIYVVNAQDVVEYRTVKLGPLTDEGRVVHEGIHSNDWVVVNGLMNLRAGAKVKPARVPGGQAAAAGAGRAEP